MKRTLLIITCMLASLAMPAQENSYYDYVPFAMEGKKWSVIRSDFGSGCHFEHYTLMNEKVAMAGKTYMKMYRSEDDLTVVYDAGLLREEDRKVYLFDTDMQKEFLMFDYSLKAGDTYETYSYDNRKMVTYKVLSVGSYTRGPQIIRYDYDERGDSMTTHQRSLRRWTVCRADDNSLQKTWIEGVGSLEGPLANLYDERPVSSNDYLTYVEYGDWNYLPFSFYDTLNGQIHGSNLPTGAADYYSEDKHHHLTYELEGDHLHVYGKAFTQCGPNNYAYFIEEPTDDPLVHILRFVIQEVEPLADCEALHSTDFYVPGFSPNMNYIVVDNQGEEHPVINRTPQNEYRPFIEDGKAWIVKVYPDGYGMVRDDTWMEYYYFDGDTIIDGQTCKQMKYVTNVGEENWVNGVFTPANHSLQYIGAWYEQDKKVYFAGNNRQQFELLYDFTLSSNDTLFLDGPALVVNKVSGGIPGFKGTYYDFHLAQDGTVVERWLEGVGSDSWPWLSHRYEFTGHQGVLLACSTGDEIIYFNSEEEDPYIMGARKGRFDFTHTVKTKPKAPMTRASEQSLYGEYNEQQLNINLDPIDDAYLVRITDETGKVVYEKAINAGSIVGINIDISSYTRGHYTVTLENSHETFTGVFEAQTSGIENHVTNEKRKSEHIYNLRGQRISYLQKGLNIVNGRKVVVR